MTDPIPHPLAATHPAWAGIAGGGVAALVLVATISVLITTARRPTGRRMAVARIGGAIAAGGLVALSLAGLMSRWGIVLSCFAFLAAVQAVALELGHADALRSYLRRANPDGDASWWPAFERRLRRYQRRRR